MNIQIQAVSETRKTVLATLDQPEVENEYRAVLAEFSREARLPGFRPGKAPANIVEQRFGKDLAEELKRRVFNRAYNDACDQHKLDIVQVIEVKNAEVKRGLSAQIEFIVDVQPEFALPEYKGLPTKVVQVEVKPEEVEQAVDAMRREKAEFKPVERPANATDYVRLSYEGRLADGRAVAEVAADRPIFGKLQQTWEEAGSEDSLLPGMGLAVIGLKSGDKKEVAIAFPADFKVEALRGLSANYAVEILEVRERSLPPLDEAFLQEAGVDTVDALKQRVQSQIQQRKEMENRQGQRRQVSDALLAAAQVAVPESALETETMNLLRSFMEENIRRGMPADEFEKNKQNLHEGARTAALNRLKLQLILLRIAQKESIQVDGQELSRAAVGEAMRAGIAPEKFAKELGKDRERLRELHRSLMLDKALAFVVSQATVTTESAPAA